MFVCLFLSQTCPGLEQYAIKKFAESLESLPRALAENAGLKVRPGREGSSFLYPGLSLPNPFLQANEAVSKLYAAHQEGQINCGLDIEGEEGVSVKDAAEAGILDLYNAKWWGIKLATNAATTVLRVDQVRTYSVGDFSVYTR